MDLCVRMCQCVCGCVCVCVSDCQHSGGVDRTEGQEGGGEE